MNRARSTSAAFVVMALLAPRVGHAQSVDVEALLRRGVELRREGREEEALARFDEAHRHQPSPRTAAQLGLALQALGRWSEADSLLRQALGSPSDSWVQRNRAVLDGAFAVVMQHIGELDLRCDVPDARVSVDGGPEQRLPLAAPLRQVAGELSFEVRADGYETARRRLVLLPGQWLREHVALRHLDPAPPAPPIVAAPIVVAPRTVVVTPTPTSGRATPGPARRGAAIGLLVGSAASLAVGIAAVVIREDLAADFNTSCPADQARCEGIRSSADSWTIGAAVTLPLAAVMSAGATLLLALPGASNTRSSSGDRRVSVGVLPSSSPFALVRVTF